MDYSFAVRPDDIQSALQKKGKREKKHQCIHANEFEKTNERTKQSFTQRYECAVDLF